MKFSELVEKDLTAVTMDDYTWRETVLNGSAVTGYIYHRIAGRVVSLRVGHVRVCVQISLRNYK